MKNHRTQIITPLAILIVLLHFLSCQSRDYKFGTIDPRCGPNLLLYVCEYFDVPASLEELCELTGYNDRAGVSM